MLSEDQVTCIKQLARLVANEHDPARFIVLVEELKDLIERSHVLCKKPTPVIPITAKSATPRLG